MEIGLTQNSYVMNKPQKPQEPTPPPGGNVENRKPPAEPTKPVHQQMNQNLNKLDVIA